MDGTEAAVSTLLAIESSTPHASLVAMIEGEVIYEGSCVSDRHHNSLIFEPLQAAVEALEGHRIDEVVIGTGPGSYSGTRVGISVGQGVAMVHECPAVGLSSLLAAGFDEATAIGDARRGSGWFAKVNRSYLPEPQLIPMEDLASAVESSKILFSFEPADRFRFPGSIAIEEAVPTARRLAEAWQALPESAKAALRAEPPQPAYLKPPHITEAKKGHPLLRGRK